MTQDVSVLERTQQGLAERQDSPRPVVPQRGALQVMVMPATSPVTAGASFSIAVTILNPFDVPIQVGSVSMVLPVDLYDVIQAAHLEAQQRAERELQRLRSDLLASLSKRAGPAVFVKEGWGRTALRAILSVVPFGLGDVAVDATTTAVAHAAGTGIRQPSVDQFLKTAARLLEEPTVVKEEGLTRDEIQQLADEILAPVEADYQNRYLLPQPEPFTVLQPGDSLTKVFTLRTKKNLGFRPTSYNLNIVLSYTADGVGHLQAVPYSLDIQASLVSVAVGAVIGAMFGVAARVGSDGTIGLLTNPLNAGAISWSIIASIALEVAVVCILSAFAVIAFARKEGVQPIIAVQDFWGGALIGFLAGYSGASILGNLFSGST